MYSTSTSISEHTQTLILVLRVRFFGVARSSSVLVVDNHDAAVPPLSKHSS